MSIELTDSLSSLLKETATQLFGAARRRFQAQTVMGLGYESGIKLTKKAMDEIEKQIQRLTNSRHEKFPNLGKWFIDICCGTT